MTAGSETNSIHNALRNHFGRPLLELFTNLTGHRLHVIWHDADEFHDPAKPPVLCPTARAWLGSGHRLSAVCADCQRDGWQPFDPAFDHGRRFQGACGAACFRTVLRGDPTRQMTLALRADALSAGFDQAVQLLQLVLLGAQGVLAATSTRHEPNQTRQPQQHVEQPTRSPRPLPAEHSHGHAVVSRVLALIHSNYQHPLTLAEVAADLRMNPNYLSSLFSATLGVTFHHCLGEIRLTRAMELLRDPAWRVCEVAAAAGFSSPCHFNNFFKAHTGLSPSAWREAATTEAPAGPAPEKS